MAFTRLYLRPLQARCLPIHPASVLPTSPGTGFQPEMCLGEPRAAAAGAPVPTGTPGEDPDHWTLRGGKAPQVPTGDGDLGGFLLGQKGTMYDFWVRN